MSESVVFNIKNPDDKDGRDGLLSFPKASPINTPIYVPNQKELNTIYASNLISKEDFQGVDIGEFTYWLDKVRLYKISMSGASYNEAKYTLRSGLRKMGDMGIKKKIIHFAFQSDVKSLKPNEIENLLLIQLQSGADVIQIPNMLSDWNYEQAIEQAIKWRNDNNIELPLMGIACDAGDIKLIDKYLGSINCIGIDFSRENIPLLTQTKHVLKSKNVWIHGFATPRYYNIAKKLATLGMVINHYGIDTVSTNVNIPSRGQNYHNKLKGMSMGEKLKDVVKSRYFYPKDYSTPTILDLNKKYKRDYQLSKLCDCPICRNFTIRQLILNNEEASANLRIHEVLAHINEASKYRNSINANKTIEFINEKVEAKKIITNIDATTQSLLS